eukprot:604599-Alexandrium_andersonii.AAC.1
MVHRGMADIFEFGGGASNCLRGAEAWGMENPGMPMLKTSRFGWRSKRPGAVGGLVPDGMGD